MNLLVLLPIFVILLVMIPMAGLTFGLTFRLAEIPFVEALAKAIQESGYSPGPQRLSELVRVLQEEYETLTQELRSVKSAQEFDRKLLSERDDIAARGSNQGMGPPPTVNPD